MELSYRLYSLVRMRWQLLFTFVICVVVVCNTSLFDDQRYTQELPGQRKEIKQIKLQEAPVIGKHTLMKTLKKGTVQHTLQESIRNFCKDSDFQRFGITAKQLLFSDKVGVVYCEVPKVACTSWKKVLHLFNGKVKSIADFKNREDVHEIKVPNLTRFHKKRRSIQWRLSHYYAFMFIRHPFKRIVSAYRNKLSDPNEPYYQKLVGSIILRKYREGLSEKEYKAGKTVTFLEFIKYILDSYQEKGLAAFDPHWQVIVSLCNPCKIKYNFIGRMENLLEDADFILNSVGFNISSFPVNGKDRYKKNIDDLMEEYFTKMPKTWIKSLYKIYEPDFLAFGYPMPEKFKGNSSSKT